MEPLEATEPIFGYNMHNTQRQELQIEQEKPGTEAEDKNIHAPHKVAQEHNKSHQTSVQQAAYTGKGSFFDTVI